MKIAYVAPYYLPYAGGVETHLAELARRMAAGGHEVEALVQSHDRSLPALSCVDGVTVRRFPLLPAPYPFAPGLWRYLIARGAAYDLIHAHSYHAFPALGVLGTRRVPLVFTPHYHGPGHTRLGALLHRPYRPVGAQVFRRAARVICVSHWEAELVRAHFPFVADRISVIPNGVDRQMIGEAAPFPVNRQIILTVGRLKTYKNVQRAIGAMPFLDERYHLVIVGDGPARAKLASLAADMRVEDRVRFLGTIATADLYRWYRTAAVYLALSRQEAFGVTVLEALAGGARPLLSDIPAHREILDQVGYSGPALVPLDIAPRTLAERIVATADQPAPDLDSLRLPTWDGVAEQTMALYAAAACVSP